MNFSVDVGCITGTEHTPGGFRWGKRVSLRTWRGSSFCTSWLFCLVAVRLEDTATSGPPALAVVTHGRRPPTIFRLLCIPQGSLSVAARVLVMGELRLGSGGAGVPGRVGRSSCHGKGAVSREMHRLTLVEP